MSEFDNIMKDLEDTLGQSINDVDRANKAMDQIEAQDVNDPSYQVPLETPSWGEEAADIILKMAEERAAYVEKFGDSVVRRADEWHKVAKSLAQSIRNTAAIEADSIRRETARMLRAGNRIEVAMKEFSPEIRKELKREPVSLRVEAPTNPQAWPTDDGKPVPGFLRRQRATLDHD